MYLHLPFSPTPLSASEKTIVLGQGIWSYIRKLGATDPGRITHGTGVSPHTSSQSVSGSGVHRVLGHLLCLSLCLSLLRYSSHDRLRYRCQNTLGCSPLLIDTPSSPSPGFTSPSRVSPIHSSLHGTLLICGLSAHCRVSDPSPLISTTKRPPFSPHTLRPCLRGFGRPITSTITSLVVTHVLVW